MRIFHVSDTHLGYSAFAKIDQRRGVNQREADFYDSFERFIDISLKEKPDLVMHTGDLFDSVRPSNRAISFAMEQIRRLSEAGIEFIAISGNHETPRLKETGSVFRILEHIPNCRFSFEDGPLRIERPLLEIICIPHSTTEQFKRNFNSISDEKKDGHRIIMMHVGVLGLDVFRTEEANELLLNASDIDPTADYVALGHYHNYVEVTRNSCYAGSTERLSISEAGSSKGYVDLDLDNGKRKFVKLPTRKMLDLPSLDISNLDAQDAKKKILNELEKHDIDGAIVRMVLKGVSRETKMDLDINSIRKSVQDALNFELKIIGKEETETIQAGSSHIGKLDEEFKSYISNLKLDNLDKKRLEAIAMGYFMEKDE